MRKRVPEKGTERTQKKVHCDISCAPTLYTSLLKNYINVSQDLHLAIRSDTMSRAAVYHPMHLYPRTCFLAKKKKKWNGNLSSAGHASKSMHPLFFLSFIIIAVTKNRKRKFPLQKSLEITEDFVSKNYYS